MTTPSLQEARELAREIGEGLEHVTAGPWIFYADRPSTDPDWHIVTTANKLRILANVHIEPGNKTDEANAAHIARCSPDNIAKLLDALDEALDAYDRGRKDERERCRPALEPFARLARHIDRDAPRGKWVAPLGGNEEGVALPEPNDDQLLCLVGLEFPGGVALDGILVGDLRRAQAILSEGDRT